MRRRNISIRSKQETNDGLYEEEGRGALCWIGEALQSSRSSHTIYSQIHSQNTNTQNIIMLSSSVIAKTCRHVCYVITLVAWEWQVSVLGHFVVSKGSSMFCQMTTLITWVLNAAAFWCLDFLWYRRFFAVFVVKGGCSKKLIVKKFLLLLLLHLMERRYMMMMTKCRRCRILHKSNHHKAPEILCAAVSLILNNSMATITLCDNSMATTTLPNNSMTTTLLFMVTMDLHHNNIQHGVPIFWFQHIANNCV